MILLLAIFLGSLVLMTLIPLRHISEIRRIDSGESDSSQLVEAESIIRARVLTLLELTEQWYQHRAKEESLKVLDRMLKMFERGAGQLAGQTKSLRLIVQERFKVIPRESLYWKQINTWKKENVSALRPHIEEEDTRDVSNHLEEF